ncbi:MAG: chemotaxis protein CheW [Thermodesulfobacteriota bacterium]
MSQDKGSARPAQETCYRLTGSFGDGTCESLALFVTCVNCPEFARIGQTLFSRRPDDSYLETWTRTVARSREGKKAEGEGYLLFTVAGQSMAVSVARLHRVFPARAIHSVPGKAETPLLGVVNLEGELTACLCLARLLGLAGAKDKSRAEAFPLVSVHAEWGNFAFPVETVSGVRRIPNKDIVPAPALAALAENALVKGIVAVDGLSVSVLDGAELARVAGNTLR